MSELDARTLAYFVFGDREEYQHELSFSVLSAIRFLRREPAPIRIVLVTEEGKYRDDLPIEHLHFSPEEFRSWCGAEGNVHRVKEFALLKTLEHFRGSVAHIDPDTWFLSHPNRLFERIGPGRTVMHEDEGPLGRHVIWRPILDRGPQEIGGVRVDPDSRMYNSGVIGIHFDDRHLLMESVAIEDALYSQSPIFNIEQFCTGAVLGDRTRLAECKDLVRHYWGPERRFINLQCARLFARRSLEHFESLVNAPSLPAVGFPPIAWSVRLRARLRGGAIARQPDYRFAYIAYLSAQQWSKRDRDMANAWLHVAVDSLSWLLSTTQVSHQSLKVTIQRDFAEVLSGNHGWIEASTRSKLARLVE